MPAASAAYVCTLKHALWNGIQRRWEKTSIFRWSSSASLTLTSLFILTVFIVSRQIDKHNLKGVWVMLSIVSIAFDSSTFQIVCWLALKKKGKVSSLNKDCEIVLACSSNFSIEDHFIWKNYPLRCTYSSSNYKDTFQLIGDASRSWSNQKTQLSRYTQ